MARRLSAFVRPPSTQEAVLSSLRDRIANGDLRPGEKVLPEQLSEEFGVSRIPIREALKILEGEGQVTYQPHRGFFVAALSVADLRELYRMRDLLEDEAIPAAVARLDDRTLGRLGALAAAAEAASDKGDVHGYSVANRRFHLEFIEVAGRPLLARTIRQLWDAGDAYRALYANSPAHRVAAAGDHQAILEALGRRDVAATLAAHEAHRRRTLAALVAMLP